MIKIENVNVSITSEADRSYKATGAELTPERFILNASVKSDSREFLERVAQAVHQQLANPESGDAHLRVTNIVNGVQP